MPYAMQCIKFNNPTPYKGGYAPKQYASRKERKIPLVVNCYEPNELGELVLVKRVRPRSR